MVDPALQAAIAVMSVDERWELIEYVVRPSRALSASIEEQKTMIRSRTGALEADPSLGLPWDDLKARLTARRG